jgi:hypothetical protein
MGGTQHGERNHWIRAEHLKCGGPRYPARLNEGAKPHTQAEDRAVIPRPAELSG